jgi:hypothetical protein
MFFTAHRKSARETEDTTIYTLSLRMSSVSGLLLYTLSFNMPHRQEQHGSDPANKTTA